MCKVTVAKATTRVGCPGANGLIYDSNKSATLNPGWCTQLWPLNPMLLLTIVPFLPTWLWLNRGYTIWFHLVSVGFLLTRSKFLRCFLIFQGVSITLGWYAAILNDLASNSRFFHILYMNTPETMKNSIFSDGGDLVFSAESLFYIFVSHAADTIGHPGLTYLFWHYHKWGGGTVRDLLSWRVVISHYLFSRLWSIVHTYYNSGTMGLFYFGFDVYNIHDLDGWYPAYIVEGIIHAGVIIWKLGWEREKQMGAAKSI
mmetsp:Transcript_62426/g.184694  ORF Transcript_62426/g.184694 Transcript_62426/m.184694 type:complete len:257 (-) Transcript_62426:111-881(-)